MKREELIKGKYYKATLKGHQYYWIFLWLGTRSPFVYIDVRDIRDSLSGGYTPEGSDFTAQGLEFEIAGEEDKLYLNACLEANAYIPRNKVIAPLYEIY